MNLEELQKMIAELEKTIGQYSKEYKTSDSTNKLGKAQDIPFRLKPAQQLLAGLGGSVNPKDTLSIQVDNMSKTPTVDKDIEIEAFTFKDAPLAHDASHQPKTPSVKIETARIKRLLNSAKIYVNTSIFPEGLYQMAMEHNLVTPNDQRISDKAQLHWQNLAVGVCHVQEIDLLVGSALPLDGKANFISLPAGTTKKENDPAILLISSPRLKFEGHIGGGMTHLFEKGLAQHLTKEQQVAFIEGMYRNIFNAAITEKREYIAMPASGLSSYGGDANVYFKALVTIAKEFPTLNIIYHPDKHAATFDQILHAEKPGNVVRATKDLIVIADRLTRQGKPCALVSPANFDVIYGLCDIGNDWKEGKNKTFGKDRFSGEEFLGGLTTAPLNSYGFNPKAWSKQNTIERKLEKPVVGVVEEITPVIVPPPVVITPPPPVIQPVTQPPEVPKGDDCNSKDKFFKPAETITPPPPKKHAAKSSLNADQTKEIHDHIERLEKEINSCWAFNKSRKTIKVEALTMLLKEAQIKSIADAIESVKKAHPDATLGSISTRTADLFEKLLRDGTTLEMNSL